MLKQKLLLILIVLFFLPGICKSDEGMWLPILIGENTYAKMQEMGLKLTPDQIFSMNNSSMKDAIVMLDGGSCSAEVVSSEGLLFTNHHCGYGEIQAHSSVDHNYLNDGFWAMSKEEELPNPGKTASFLVRIEDVTQQALDKILPSDSEIIRDRKIIENFGEIIKNATENTYYNAEVVSMFSGNQYFLFVYETFRDVRLVGAPPSSIGDYGGDIDNWMWPRHTGDFSVFRIYCAPDGNPAEYSPENIPITPEHFLPISIKGIQKDDFAMVWGNPGTTDRYLASRGVDYALKEFNPAIVKLGGIMLEEMKKEMEKSDEVHIKYASKYAMIANFWKLYYGQSRGLKRLNVIKSKKEIEDNFVLWIRQNPEKRSEYASIISDFDEIYDDLYLKKYALANIYFALIYNYGVEIFDIADNNDRFIVALESNNKEAVKDIITEMKEHAEHFYKDYYYVVDKNKCTKLLKAYISDIPKELQCDLVPLIQKKYKGDVDKYTDMLYTKSIFATHESFLKFLEKPSAKTLKNDPVYLAFNMLLKKSNEIAQLNQYINEMQSKANRLFLKGLMEMNNDKEFYPNANSTMRMSYGKVSDYYPADGVYYSWQTFMKGIMEKEDSESEEFIVPERLKEIYENKDFGIYGEGNKMPVCFLTNHDITGGSSGSSVINGNGELIGLAFDSNWEGVSGDIAYNSKMQRCVNVDIRYVLLIIDKFAGAKNLIKELEIVQ